MDNIETKPVKKSSGFKRSIIYIAVLGILGGCGYLAYQEGAMDAYLPKQLKAIAPAPEPVVEPAKVEPVAPVSDAPAVSDAPSSAKPSDVQAALSQLQGAQSGNATTAVATPNAAPVTISINGAPANALLSAYDAQWQWQSIEQSFKNQGDVTNTLQSVQALKTQLQAINSPALAPALTAVAQVETQLQEWSPMQTSAIMTALSQSIMDVDAMTMNLAKDEDISVSSGEQSWWQRTLASLKNVIEIKRVDEQKNSAALSESTAALVKQSIVARLSSAQLAAQMGQWQLAQSHALAAQAMAEKWADAGALSKIKPLLDIKTFPAAPNFATVNAALMQARTQLMNEAHAAQSAPAPASPVAPVTSTSPATNAPAPKGGA